jgi:putative aldouronate transport system substrate-binding protein
MKDERRTSTHLSRRDALRVAAGAAMTPLLVGRGVAAQGDATPAPDDQGFFPSPIEGVPDAYYRYPEPFQTVAQVPGSGGTVSLALLSDKRIKARDENAYWQELEARLGVTIDAQLWPGAAYAERMATTIAGGDFPDLMHVFTLLYPQATEFQIQGAFADLTQYLDGDARNVFPNLAAFPSYSWENSKVNGVQYGVPNPTSLQPNALWYRADWLETVGLAAPTNAAEALGMWQAFAQNDPDGNGAADTYGLSFERLNAIEQRFIHGMFRVLAEGDDFILAPDGTFVHAIETPEFRTSLEYMQQVWASGACHPDSLTQTSNEVREQLIAGTAGSGANAFILYGFIRDEAVKINPNAQIQGLVPPGHDGGEGVAYNIGGWFGQFCIPSSITDEARLQELLRITDYFAAPFGSEEYTFLNYGIEGVHHTVAETGARVLTQQGEEEIFSASLGGLNVLYDADRDRIKYVQDVMAAQTRIGVFSPTVNLYSPTAAATAGELGQLYTDRMIEIGTGRAPIDALDDWIADWKSRGGDQIRQEYQEAYAQAQG